MPPLVTESNQGTRQIYEHYAGKSAAEIGTDFSYKLKLYKPAVAFMVLLHLFALVGFYNFLFVASWKSDLWCFFLAELGSEAVTIGVHRYYTHRSFKATFLLRFMIVVFDLIAGQNSIYTWVRDHRIHHKYSDTDADPHNATRGFFFSHMGWLMYKKHPAFKVKCKTVDLADLEADPLVMFQYKHFFPLYFLVSIVFPVAIPIYFFGETFLVSLTVCYFWRYVWALHFAWTVNSYAHIYGNRPYDKTILPTDNYFVSAITNGEGWHNYHHAFPWDYKASEYGMRYNFSATIIETLVNLGLAYDLKMASDDMVSKRKERTGDGSDYSYYKYK